tara:strand:- start:5381 stop:5533 length:153 start_codon:yes stop_codon:yes gene_type:complete
MFINLENVIDYDDNTIQEEQSQMLYTTWEEATEISFDEAQQQLERKQLWI